MVFDVAASDVLSDEQKALVIARLGPVVRAVAQEARSQSRNRDLAMRRLQERVERALTVRRPRTATKPTAGSRRRRLEAKRRQSQRKADRRPPDDRY